MNPHFILDFETIGQDVFTIPIVNCSYYVFDWDRFTSPNPYTFEELISEIKFAKLDIPSQLEHGYKYKKSDLDWWMSKEEAKRQLKPSDKDITVTQFTKEIYDYLNGTKISRWWSRSNTFDPILLHRSFLDFSSREKLDYILPYWLIRDIRTYIDTRFDFTLKRNNFVPVDDVNYWNRVFVAHNSVHDVAADILRLQKIERYVNE